MKHTKAEQAGSKLQKYCNTHWLYLAIPFTTLLFTEYLLRLSILDTGLFFLHSPLYALLNFLLIASLYWVLSAIIPNKYINFGLLFFLSSTLGFAGRIKFAYRQTGPMLTDIGLLGEASAMWRVLSPGMVTKSLLAALIVGGILFWMTHKAKQYLLTSKERVAGIAVFLLLWVGAYFGMPARLYQTQNNVIVKQNVLQTGTYAYFAATLKPPTVPPSLSPEISSPPSTSSSNTSRPQKPSSQDAQLASWFTQMQQNTTLAETNSPDIIVIQSESFYDPTQTMGMEMFSQDPLPFFHSLQEKSNSFTATTPAFGGDTVNAEFEVLTGLSTGVFPANINMFTDVVQKPTLSLGWILDVQGYDTSALHPFNTQYYRRDTVYQLFGFHHFYGLESLEKNDPNFRANAFTQGDLYGNDLELTNQIIQQLEAGNNPNKFVFAISMQNHIPYAHQYPGYEMSYLGQGNQRAVDEFSNFLSGLKKTDQSLQNLIQYLETREKETIVLFYGDHHPALEINRLVADASNPIKDQQHYQVPALIWSNKQTLTTQQNLVDMVSIPEMLLTAGNLEIPPHFQTLRTLREQGLNSFTDYYVIINDEIFYKDTPQYKEVYTALEEMKNEAWSFVPSKQE